MRSSARAEYSSSKLSVASLTTEASRAITARSRGWLSAGPSGGRSASANLEALSSFTARRRPTFICCGSNAVSVPGRPVAHGGGSVLLEQVHRRDDVALGLGHLLAVRVEHPAGDRGVAPRQHVV